MKELISSGKVYVTGRGNIYLIDLKFNNIPQERKDFTNVLKINSEVSIDGIVGKIKGIEAFATGDHFIHNKIGILLKEN